MHLRGAARRLTGFLGPNGAGKTTAMRTVFGLLRLDAVTVRWRGEPIVEADRARFWYLPEERGLYPRMRVREQLLYLGRLCGRSSAEVGRVTDLWLERLGIAERAGARVDELSHGNQQRVQLVAALVNEPDLLVLDEPFASLDPIAMAVNVRPPRSVSSRRPDPSDRQATRSRKLRHLAGRRLTGPADLRSGFARWHGSPATSIAGVPWSAWREILGSYR